MKRRFTKLLIFLICLAMVPCITANALEKESLEQFAGTDRLWNSLPDQMDENALQELLEEKNSSSFAEKFWESILSLGSIGLGSGIKLLARLCTLLLFAALFRALKDSFASSFVESAFDFLIPLCLALIVYSSLQECLALSKQTLESIHAFFLASIPVTTVLLTLSGSPGAAGTLASSIHFVITTVSTLIASFLTPLLNALFAFSFLDGILDGGVRGFLSFLKKTVKVLCVLFFTVTATTLSLQNALATAADSVAMRSVRFAAGTFIPVVGSLVGESSKTLAASFSAVKTECGVLCLLVLLYVLLRPILFIAVQKVFLGFASAFAEVLNETGIYGYLKSLSGVLDLFMALLISEGCYLVFYVTLFIKAKGGA